MFQRDTASYLGKLLETMVWANNEGRNGYAGINSVYGKCRDAIVEIVERECNVNISEEDWNLGGNNSYLEDIEVCIENTRKKLENTIIIEQDGDDLFTARFGNDELGGFRCVSPDSAIISLIDSKYNIIRP